MCRAEGMLDAFGWLGYGAVLVGRDGRVVELNREAQNHLGASLRLVHGRLAARDRRARRRLQELLAGIAEAPPDRPNAPSTAVLPRAGARPMVAYAAPVPPAAFAGRPGGIVLLLDPDMRREPGEALLRQAFGFTPAEIRLALGLAQNHDLRTIAARH